MRRAALAVLTAVLGAACAKVPVVVTVPTRADLVILLPGADGSVGALTVTHGDKSAVLDTPHAAAKIETPGSLEATRSSPDEVSRIFQAALSAQPPRPTSFTIYFLHDSDELTPESKDALGGILREIARRPAPEVVVIGHTDTVGTDEHNDRLSLQRATSIRTRLVGLGIVAEHIQVAGRGKRELLVQTGDQVAEPRNRRVEIVVK